ncbi:ral guanine nucleotide dissociation stimulator-like [Eumetopias jubatus]|uniref:ral guanine nucleotide dissociation stimulator-like n=1 Tax=Eumetopias jubatus TaxID=34886 RepID=UPI0010166CD6|nr:ral guanine nucleotide dissociation stimulator-like [Eumetopias jubatus]
MTGPRTKKSPCLQGPSPPFWAPGWTSTRRTSVSPDVPCLKQLVAHVQLNMPGSDLERRAHLLMAQLEHAELTQADPEDEKTGAAPPSEELERLHLHL